MAAFERDVLSTVSNNDDMRPFGRIGKYNR